MENINSIINKSYSAEACGIYFLISKGNVVYVGQSLCIYARIGTHLTEKSKQFDSWSWIPCDASLLDSLEEEYILKFNPIYNKIIKGWYKQEELQERMGVTYPQYIPMLIEKYKPKIFRNKYKLKDMNTIFLEYVGETENVNA